MKGIGVGSGNCVTAPAQKPHAAGHDCIMYGLEEASEQKFIGGVAQVVQSALRSVHTVNVETQAGIEHACELAGKTSLSHELLAHETDRVWKPVPQETEHDPHCPVVYVGPAGCTGKVAGCTGTSVAASTSTAVSKFGSPLSVTEMLSP